jgi:acyl-coenzyme A synthetase/AMP-(fatty) acid ligase
MTASLSNIGTLAVPVSLSLRERLRSALAGRDDAPALSDGLRSLPLSSIAEGNWIEAPAAPLAGRCVLVLTTSQIGAALALVSLDGVAARIVLCPPDLRAADLPDVIVRAGVDAVVCDAGSEAIAPLPDLSRYHISASDTGAGASVGDARAATEWVMFTSGTSGAPKMVAHTLQGLTGAISPAAAGASIPTVWGTFYDIRRYGGLQILLRALVGGRSMVLSQAGEFLDVHLDRLRQGGVTHLTGTPSHWRRVLMTPGLGAIAPAYVRLSGEIADQAVLDSLAMAFPNAAIGHAYASTEAGVGFEVNDGLAGFPASLIERDGPVRMQVVDGTLQLSSTRAAAGYVGHEGLLVDPQGFVDTGDMVERRDDRYHFVGRRSGVVNVGGLKVHPEEVEAVINTRPGVRLSRVKGRRSPITGAILEAEVVLTDPMRDRTTQVRDDILAHCRAVLPPFKVPTSIRFVETLPLTAGGKLERSLA